VGPDPFDQRFLPAAEARATPITYGRERDMHGNLCYTRRGEPFDGARLDIWW
jgi:hypothetical protein